MYEGLEQSLSDYRYLVCFLLLHMNDYIEYFAGNMLMHKIRFYHFNFVTHTKVHYKSCKLDFNERGLQTCYEHLLWACF